MLRIPASITLPFGYKVTIKQLSDQEFDTHASDADGLWVPETRTILIRKRLPAKRRAYLLVHELGHAWLDFSHQYLDNGDVKP